MACEHTDHRAVAGQGPRVRFSRAGAADCALCGQPSAHVAELVGEAGESLGQAVVCARCQVARHRAPNAHAAGPAGGAGPGTGPAGL